MRRNLDQQQKELEEKKKQLEQETRMWEESQRALDEQRRSQENVKEYVLMVDLGEVEGGGSCNGQSVPLRLTMLHLYVDLKNCQTTMLPTFHFFNRKRENELSKTVYFKLLLDITIFI